MLTNHDIFILFIHIFYRPYSRGKWSLAIVLDGWKTPKTEKLNLKLHERHENTASTIPASSQSTRIHALFIWFQHHHSHKTKQVHIFFIIDKNIVAAEYNWARTSIVHRAARTRGAGRTELIARGFLSFPYRCALVSALSSLLPINRLTDQ